MRSACWPRSTAKSSFQANAWWCAAIHVWPGSVPPNARSYCKATEEVLSSIRQCVQRPRAPYRGKDKIARRVEREAAKYKMLKHFDLDIGEDYLRWQRKEDGIRAESALDGFYVIRAGRIERAEMSAERLVESYKSLGRVEQAFRCLKTIDLHMRPIFHHLEDMVRAHALLCMLAYYVDWHMRKALAPMLFAEDDPQGAAAKRSNPVEPAQPSDSRRSQGAREDRCRGAAGAQLPHAVGASGHHRGVQAAPQARGSRPIPQNHSSGQRTTSSLRTTRNQSPLISRNQMCRQ